MIKDFLHIFYPQTYKLANGKEVKEKFKENNLDGTTKKYMEFVRYV